MKKQEAIAMLSGDPALFATAFPGVSTFNGFPFKDWEAYDKGDVCYISESALGDLERGEGDEDDFYTKEDFIEIAGDERKARLLFEAVDWQHPESFWDEAPELFD